jgi:GxxExxY protein
MGTKDINEKLKKVDTEELIKTIVNCAYNVRSQLPSGFVENIYKNAMFIEMKDNGINIETEVPLQVFYKDVVVGEFRADMIAEKKVIIELKAVSALCTAHEVQLVNYLTALKIDNGLLINFGADRIEIKRKYRQYKKTFKT